jgi:3-phenylpropionate/trans-cinnamate dioxygenase ferredoxin reductase subunit
MSEHFELLVIGGGPAGLEAARGYRDAGGEGPVAIISDDYRMPYDRPALTKALLRGESEESDLPLEDERWLVEQRVDLIAGRAVKLDPGGSLVLLSGGRELTYGSCVIATGAEPTRLPVPGSDHPAVRVLRSLHDLRELQSRLRPGTTTAVIGSGFIGCEIAASLRIRGHQVSLVSDESAPNQARLGDEAAARIADWLADAGVKLHLGVAVGRIEAGPDGQTVCAGDARIGADVVIMAVGVRPRSELASLAGIECERGAITVQAGMQTAAAGLFAVGDVCLAQNTAAGRPLRVEHWGDALKHGEIAGRNAAGAHETWSEVPGFWSTIGEQTLKYAAWGDGFETAEFIEHDRGALTVLYRSADVLVGVLTHEADEDYERGSEVIARRGTSL